MPPTEIYENGTRYVISKVAAKKVGLVADYNSRMCRSGQVNAKRHANLWYVEEESLLLFLKKQTTEYEHFKHRKSEAGKALREKPAEIIRHKLTISPHAVLREYTRRMDRGRKRRERLIRNLAAPVLTMCMLVSTSLAFELMSPPGSVGKFAAMAVSGRAEVLAKLTATSAAGRQFAAVSSLPFVDSLASKVFTTICPYFNTCSQEKLLDTYLAVHDPQIKNKQAAPIAAKTVPQKAALPIAPLTATATAAPNPVQQTVINNPVIERIRETVRTITEPGLNTAYVDARIAALSHSLLAQLAPVSASQSRGDSFLSLVEGITQDGSLTGTHLTAITVSGVSGLTDADIPDSLTASNYLPLSGGTLSGSLIGTDLTLSGNITAGTLSVAGLSSGGAIAAPYFTATSTSASSTFTNFNVTNSTTTNATSTNLFSTFGRFTSGIIDTLTVPGTASTSALVVSSQCVTADTRLRRRRKAKKGEKGADKDGYIYEEVAIVDIEEGDEVQSLDQKTGKLVWSRVKGVVYTGTKEIFKITTARSEEHTS